MTRPVAFVLVVAAAAFVVAADPPKPAKVEDLEKKATAVREKFYGCWLATEETRAGERITDPKKLFGYEFRVESESAWERRSTGELSAALDKPGPRVDPTADPMRVDFVGRGRSRNFGGSRGDEEVPIVRPCIFKFEDGNLVIAFADRWTEEKEFKKGEDYPERPTDFTSTKDNKRTVRVMKPSSFWAED